MSVIRLAIATTLVLVPAPLLAQSRVEKHVGVGLANFLAPIVSAGADTIRPLGLGVGASGTLVTTGSWALYGLSARAGFHGRRHAKTQPLFLAELGYFKETDCCGGGLLTGVTVGITHWRNLSSGFRIEGRLLLPRAGEGVLIIFQIGLTFQ